MQNRDEIKKAVLAALQDVCGQDDLSSIAEDTNVVKTLGLDSDDGNDLACILAIRLGFDIPDYINPLFNESKPTDADGFERTVGDIVNLLCQLSIKGGLHV